MIQQILASRVSDRLSFAAEVRVEPFDFGNALGVAVLFPHKRHAVRVKIEDYDLTSAADLAAEALNEWFGE